MKPMNVRQLAARIIHDVTDGRSLADNLAVALAQLTDKRDRAFVQALCYGVCRHYPTLDVVLSHLLQRPMNATDGDVHALLLVGLYQLMHMRVPAHAAVAETVNATAALKKSWARGFVNAILREYLRQQASLTHIIQADQEAVFAHPRWWIDSVRKAWPLQWQQVLNANNEHPPFSLRVNVRKMSRADYMALCQTQLGIKTEAIIGTHSGFTLDEPIQVEALPGFGEGMVTVQDGAAQLAADWLALQPGMRVLDACAAPGGKLTHILEKESALAACVAVDNDATRMALIKENLTRLFQTKDIPAHVSCLCADVADTAAWWNGQLFDRILLDAPCSASGVVRRHPDIKLLREPHDINVLAKKQRKLLEALWPLLKPGGMVMYVTCSVFPEENYLMLRSFLETHPDAVERIINTELGVACDVGRQILPGMHNMDGFYYATLQKDVVA